MKYKAYQIAPEYQKSPLHLGRDFAEFEGMEIFGNRHYESRTSQTFDNVRDALYHDNFDAFDVSIQDENGEEITSVYTYEHNQDKEEIAEALGVNTADIVLYRFDGWTKTEKYKRED